MFNGELPKVTKDRVGNSGLNTTSKSLQMARSPDQFALPSPQVSFSRRNTDLRSPVENYTSPTPSQFQRVCSASNLFSSAANSPCGLFCSPRGPTAEQYNSDGEIDYSSVFNQKRQANELEESKNLQKVLQCFSYCQTELSNVFTQINQLVEKDTESASGNIVDALEKVSLAISNHSAELQTAIQLSENDREELLKVQLDLQKEKAKHEHLENQLALLRKEKDKLKTAEVRRTFFEGCEDIKECVYNHFLKLQQDIEKQSCTLENHCTDLHCQTVLTGQSHVQDTCMVLAQMERSLTVRMDQKCSTAKDDELRFQQNLQDQLIEINQKHREEVKLLFKQQLQHIQQECSKKKDNNFQHLEAKLRNIQNKHMATLQNFIRKEALQSTNVPQQEIRKVVEDIFEKEKQKEHMLLRYQQEKLVKDMEKTIADKFEQERQQNERLRRQYHGDSSVPGSAVSHMGVRSFINSHGLVNNTLTADRPNRYSPSELLSQNGSSRLRTMELTPQVTFDRTLDARELFRQPQHSGQVPLYSARRANPTVAQNCVSTDTNGFTTPIPRIRQAQYAWSQPPSNQITTGFTTPLPSGQLRSYQLQDRVATATPLSVQSRAFQQQDQSVLPLPVASNTRIQAGCAQQQDTSVTPLTGTINTGRHVRFYMPVNKTLERGGTQEMVRADDAETAADKPNAKQEQKIAEASCRRRGGTRRKQPLQPSTIQDETGDEEDEKKDTEETGSARAKKQRPIRRCRLKAVQDYSRFF